MKRLLKLRLLFTLLILAGCAPIQPAPAAIRESAPVGELPFDPAVRSGVLDNGLKWFVRANSEPPQRAELWLAVNAGSNQETDDQRGLAHFLEHMLFNGTESWPETELVHFLESLGMQFGPDVNAYTSFEETVYTLQVPTDDAAVLEQGVHVLKEWASAALIDVGEVDKERGVIVEEWRMRQLNADGRVTDELIRAVLAGSHYVDRMPIGDMEIVRNAPAETLRAYYEQWYRPDNMAVIAVGDFADLDAIQALIVREFGALENPAAALEFESYSVPDYADTTVQIITDPELTSTDVNVVFKQAPTPGRTLDDLREGLIAQMALQVLNYRYQEITQGANPPFLYAVSALQPFVRAADLSLLYAGLEPDGVEAGLTSLMNEVERLRRFGVTQAEFARARTDLLRSLQSAADEAQNQPNASHAAALLETFLVGEVAVAPDDLYALSQELFATVSLEEVNQAAADLFPTTGRVAIVTAPASAEAGLPTEETLLGAMVGAESAELEAPVDAISDGPLLESLPEAAAVIERREIPEVGVTVVTFANGLQLYLKPTDFKDDEVLFELMSPGGVSAVSDDLAAMASWAPSLAEQSGVAQMNLTALQRALTGSTASVSPYVDETGEGFMGSASPQDLETLFQLVWLYVNEPRVDAEALQLFQRQVGVFLSERGNQPESLLDDRLVELHCGADTEPNPRCNWLDALAEVATFDTVQTLEVLQERLGDFGDGTAFLVGSFDLEQAIALAQRYLGTLPADGRSESWQDLLPPPPATPIREELFKGIDARAYVYLNWLTPFSPTLESRVAARALEGVVDILVREKLREEMGGIYGAYVSAGIGSIPDGELDFGIQFTAEPTRVVELVGAIDAILVDLRDNGPSEDVLERTRAQISSDHEENLEVNDAWLSWLWRYVVAGEGSPEDVLLLDEAIAAVSAADVQALAEAALQADGVIQLILYPEGFAP